MSLRSRNAAPNLFAVSLLMLQQDAANDLAPLLNRSRIDAAFQKLGASTEALDLETPIRPVASTRSSK